VEGGTISEESSAEEEEEARPPVAAVEDARKADDRPTGAPNELGQACLGRNAELRRTNSQRRVKERKRAMVMVAP
jgi:hypothetical protein